MFLVAKSDKKDKFYIEHLNLETVCIAKQNKRYCTRHEIILSYQDRKAVLFTGIDTTSIERYTLFDDTSASDNSEPKVPNFKNPIYKQHIRTRRIRHLSLTLFLFLRHDESSRILFSLFVFTFSRFLLSFFNQNNRNFQMKIVSWTARAETSF